MTAPVVGALSRIADIRSRFEAPVVTPGAGDFDALLSSALEDGTGLGVDAQGAGALGGSDVTMGLQGYGLGSAATGQAVVNRAMGYLGVPYQWGGTDPATGLDCSGFVQKVFGDLGIELPRVSRDQARTGTEVASIEQARPGDILAFGHPVNHVAIYVGDGRMVHAPRTGEVVKVEEIDRPITSIRRVTATSGATGAGVAGAGAVSSSAAGSASGIPAGTPYADLFVAAGQKYGLDPKLLAAVAKQESGFNPNAVSSAGAQGLMQFMPATARAFGINPLDPAQAVDGAARYLSEQVRAFGSIELALAAYNAGPGAVRKHGGIPPYPETQRYVPKVMAMVRDGW